MPYYPLTIQKIVDETPDAYSVYFEKPDNEVFDYLPGQYLTLKLDVNGESLRRAFSLSSSPETDAHLSVTIKRVQDGKASNYIRDNMKAGNVVEVLAPMGNFRVRTDADNRKHYILIGAGSGITPLMSILKSVIAAEPNSKVSLWYCNRNEASIIFRSQLDELQSEYGEHVSVYHTLSQPDENWTGPSGRLDQQRIYDMISHLFMTDVLRKVYYICGPSGMIEDAQAALEKHAVNPADVHRELYTVLPPTEAEVEEVYSGQKLSDGEETYELKTQSVSLTLDNALHTVSVDPEKSILDAAIEAELDPPFACQSGICTTCRAMLKSGVVMMDEIEGLSDNEIGEGFILTCQSHPLTDDVEIEYR